MLIDQTKGLDIRKVDLIIDFLSMDNSQIRRPVGSDFVTEDVPVWEHSKRTERFTIKPLIQVKDDLFIWGATSLKRVETIWWGSLTSGLMPASFEWPNVRKSVRRISKLIEDQLEVKTHEIIGRYSKYCEANIDFYKRFPSEAFSDVGDFDALAYWPKKNTWLIAECKYNQPVFCVKDGRRRRNTIFDSKRGQFPKIERRRTFLSDNLEKIRTTLGWPPPDENSPPLIQELYVSRETGWWLRNTPYDVPTIFLQIDALDGWLKEQGFEQHP